MTGRVPFELERWKLPLYAAANRSWCLFVSRKLIRPPLQKKSSPYAGRLFRLTYEYHPTGNVNEIDRQMLYRSMIEPLEVKKLPTQICRSRRILQQPRLFRSGTTKSSKSSSSTISKIQNRRFWPKSKPTADRSDLPPTAHVPTRVNGSESHTDVTGDKVLLSPNAMSAICASVVSAYRVTSCCSAAA